MVPLSEAVSGNSTVVRTFEMSRNPYADDPRALGEPLRDTVTWPSAAKRVRDAREAAELTAAELAQRAKIATADVEAAERAILPPPDVQAALLQALKIEGNPWEL